VDQAVLAAGKRRSAAGSRSRELSRSKKKKTASASAAATETPSAAFTVQTPNPAERARLLASRGRGEEILTAANLRRRQPVNGTCANGRVLGRNNSLSGGGSAMVAEDEAGIYTANIALDHPQDQQQMHQSGRKARQSFLATQEAKMEDVSRRREETIQQKRQATELLLAPLAVMAKEQWDALAARLDGESLGNIRRLLEVVLRNAATKSDPKYKRLKTSNRNLWMGLLKFEEVVAILEKSAGFERRVIVGTNGNKQIESTEALRIKMERDRINLEISQALNDESNNPDTIASLIADLDSLEVAAATNVNQQQPSAVCAADEAQNFELSHVGAGEDGLGIKKILSILCAVEIW